MELNIESEDHEFGGRFYAVLDAENEAEITYVHVDEDDQLRVCNHTGVPPQYEGQGIALQLVKALVDDARANKIKYIPQCPYVAVQFKRHPEWSDVFVAL